MTAVTQDTRLAERLSLRIGAVLETMIRLAGDIREDEMVLALFASGTPPEDTGFASEDECAAFIADADRALTAKQAELEGLREQLAALDAQVPA